MLQNIGDTLKGHRWLGVLLLGVLGLIFAMWGAYGVVDLSFGTPNYALKVNGEEIPTATVQQAWQRQQAEYQQQLKGDIPAAQRAALQQQLLDQYIDATTLSQRARQRGFRVDDQALAETYRSQAAFQIDGKFSKEAAQAALLQAGISAAVYEADLRASMQTAQLTQGLQATDFLTGTEAKRIFALENEQRELRYAVLPAERYAAAVVVDEAKIKAWYDSHSADYQTPESVRLQYAELKLDALATTVAVDQVDLEAWYEANKSRYAEPEKRHARHILIQLADGANAATSEAALQKAQDVLAQARSGKDFSALARQYSDDPGSKAQGGDLGWAQRGAYVQAFSDALFAMKAGDISDPIKTQFGYHIIKLDEIQATSGKSLADSRPQIEADYRRDRASELFGDRQEQLQQRLESGGGVDLQTVAKEFGLQLGEVEQFTRSGASPLGSSADLTTAVFSDEVVSGARIGGPVALAEDHLVLVKVLEHRLPKLQPLAEVREDVIDELRASEGSTAARAAADSAVKQLNEGAQFDAVLKTLGVSAAPARFVGRGDPQLPVQVRDAAFALAVPQGKPAYRAISMEEGGAALLTVNSVRAGEAGANPTNDEQLTSQYIKRQSDAESTAYLLELRRRANVRRNDAVFN